MNTAAAPPLPTMATDTMAAIARIAVDIRDVVASDVTAEEIADALYLAALMPYVAPTSRDHAPTSGTVAPFQPPISASSPSDGNTEANADVTDARTPAEQDQRGTAQSSDLFTDAQQALRNLPTNDLPPPRLVAASRLRVPSGRALTDALGIARALRPLLRRIPSRSQMVLDIEQTVDKIARDSVGEAGGTPNLWTPVLRPESERWLSVDLVEDDARTMAPWQETIDEFAHLLQRTGGFRSVRRWTLHTTTSDAGDDLVLRRRNRCGVATGDPDAESPNNSDRIGAVAILRTLKGAQPEGAGGRLVFVLSDCIGCGWHNDGAAWGLMAGCGQFAPTALIQVLPERLWSQTGMRPESTQVWATEPGTPNHHLIRRGPAESAAASAAAARPLVSPAGGDSYLKWLFEDEDGGGGAMAVAEPAPVAAPSPVTVPIPILTLSAGRLGAFAKLVAGRTGEPVSAVRVQVPDTILAFIKTKEMLGFAAPVAAAASPYDNPKLTAEQRARLRVETFRAASSLAQKLAVLLTAAEPLCLPVIRLVRDALLPEATESHIAEILLSGLLQQVNPVDATLPPLYEWREGVADVLRRGLQPTDKAKVIRRIGEWMTAKSGSPTDFAALIEDPTGTDHLLLTERTMPFARLTVEQLRRLGYESEANRLSERIVAIGEDQIVAPRGLTLQRTLRAFNGRIAQIAWSPDGRLLATPSGDGTIGIWDGASGTQRTLIRNAANSDRTFAEPNVHAVAWSPDGNRLAAAYSNGFVRVWEIQHNGFQAVLLQQLHHDDEVMLCAWSPDKELLATGTSDGTMGFWEVQNHWRKIAETRGSEINHLCWSSDGQLLLSGDRFGAIFVRRREALQNPNLYASTAREDERAVDAVTALSLSPVRNLPTVGTNSGQLLVLHNPGSRPALADDASDRILHRFRAHDCSITALAFSPDENVLATGGANGVVRLWRCDTWRQEGEMLPASTGGVGAGLAWNPEKPTLATIAEDGRSVRLWHVEMTRLLTTPVVLPQVGLAATPPPETQTPQEITPPQRANAYLTREEFEEITGLIGQMFAQLPETGRATRVANLLGNGKSMQSFVRALNFSGTADVFALHLTQKLQNYGAIPLLHEFLYQMRPCVESDVRRTIEELCNRLFPEVREVLKRKIPTDDFPDCCAVGTEKRWTGSGVLIAPNLVLTARHIKNARRVLVGGNNVEESGGAEEIIGVLRQINHPIVDLSVLLLEKNAATPPRRFANDADFPFPCDEGTAAGFGILEPDGWLTYGRKHRAVLPVRSWDGSDLAADEATRARMHVGHELLCPSRKGYFTSSQGDAGGPFYAQTAHGEHVLVATNSRGVPNSGSNYDGGIFVRVDKFVNWIERETGVTLLNRPEQPQPGTLSTADREQLTEIVLRIVPHDAAARDALLFSALYAAEPLRRNINTAGTSRAFIEHLLMMLERYGNIGNEPALVVFLQNAQQYIDDDGKALIDDICAKFRVVAPPPSTPTPKRTTALTREEINKVEAILQIALGIFAEARVRHFLLARAFGDSHLGDSLDFAGAATIFVPRLIQSLLRYGSFAGRPALVVLLESLRDILPSHINREIDELCRTLEFADISPGTPLAPPQQQQQQSQSLADANIAARRNSK